MKQQILNIGKVLTKVEQRSINGGNVQEDVGTCGYKSPTGSVWCNLSKSQAKAAYDKMGGNWCCDSCDTASYC